MISTGIAFGIWLMFIDVVTAIIGISVLLFFVKTPDRSQVKENEAGAKQYFLEIGEGIKYVSKKPFLKKFLLLSALFNILVAPVAALRRCKWRGISEVG